MESKPRILCLICYRILFNLDILDADAISKLDDINLAEYTRLIFHMYGDEPVKADL